MTFRRSDTIFSTIVALLAAWTGAIGTGPVVHGQGYHPEHPAIQKMINAGVEYLSNSPLRGDSEGGPEGTRIMAALAVYKVTYEANHRVVQMGIEAARKMAIDVSNANSDRFESKIIYSISIAGILLATVDVDKYNEEIRIIQAFLIRSQKPHGGFGYLDGGPYFRSGDISQTQYAMLALWTMNQVNVEVPEEVAAKGVNFLVSAQTNDGGWPYQYGGDGGSSGGATHSLSAAGLSALLIGGDMLGLYRSKYGQNDEDDGVPEAFRRIEIEKIKKRPAMDRARVDEAMRKGEAYHRNKNYERAVWYYYYLYSVERFESFLEFAKHKKAKEKSPGWYNQIAEDLMKAQAPDGAWGKESGGDKVLAPDICTSFAVLFLIRSTQKAISEMQEAVAEGGQELPKDLRSVKAGQGKVISKTETTSIDDALKMLEDEGKSDGEDSLAPERMRLAKDPKARKEQLNRFSRLLNSKEFKAR